MKPEPIFDLAHLGHMELLTPKPDESLKFFVDVMGMTISGRNGGSVYLCGWDDYERYSLKLTASKTSGMEHMALRARSPQALQRRVAALKGSEFEIGWTDGDIGHGPAFRCRDPDGHIIELYYETEWYEAPPDLKPALKNQAPAVSRARRQCPPPRPPQLPGGGHQGQPHLFRDLSRLPPDRADRA
jgi:catechol 2,3-dioxygenase